MCVRVCMCAGSSADQNLDSERISILHDRSPNLKWRGDEIEELRNRLKISIDRRSFKFRHPGDAQNITLMIYDLSWNVYTVRFIR